MEPPPLLSKRQETFRIRSGPTGPACRPQPLPALRPSVGRHPSAELIFPLVVPMSLAGSSLEVARRTADAMGPGGAAIDLDLARSLDCCRLVHVAPHLLLDGTANSPEMPPEGVGRFRGAPRQIVVEGRLLAERLACPDSARLLTLRPSDLVRRR